MKHHRTSAASREARSRSKAAAEALLGLPGPSLAPRPNLLQLVITVGLQAFQRMLEQDREELCGARYRQQPDRQATRYGFNHGAAVLG